MSFQRVLFIRFSAIGDVVLTTPILRFFRETCPDSRIDFLVKESLMELLQFHPFIHRLLPFPEKPGAADLLRIRRLIQHNQYDAIFDLQKHWRSLFVTGFLPNTQIYRYNKYSFRRFLLVAFKWNRYRNVPEKIPLRYFQVFRTLNWQWTERELEIFFPPGRSFPVLQELSGTEKKCLVAFAPGAGHETKRWPMEKFAELIETLSSSLNASPVLIGGKDDESVCREIEKRVKQKPLNLCGRTSLLETAAVLRACRLLVTNDTGVMHLAIAVRTPVVAIFGPTVKEFGFFPFTERAVVVENPELSCRPCSFHGARRCPRGHFRCLKEISVDRVWDAAMKLLSVQP